MPRTIYREPEPAPFHDQYILVPASTLTRGPYITEPPRPRDYRDYSPAPVKPRKQPKPKRRHGRVVIAVCKGVYELHRAIYSGLWNLGPWGRLVAALAALVEVAALHALVAEAHATDAETKACTDAGHQMMQVGSTNRLRDALESINLQNNVAADLSKTRGYTISATRLTQANPGLFDTRDTHGPQCVNVPGPIPYGFAEADGDQTIGEYRKYEYLSADEFSKLNPGLPKADDYVPAAGTVVKWGKRFDVSLALTTAPKTLGAMAHGEDKQSQVKKLVGLNYIALGHGGRIVKGEPAYLPMKQTAFERRNGIEISDVVAEYNEAYLHMPKTQRVQPKQIVKPRKHSTKHKSRSAHRPVRIDRVVHGVKIPELRNLSRYQSVKATTALAKRPGWHNRAVAMRRLMDNADLTDYQAAALIGGFMTESASVELEPAREQFNDGPGRGLAQWEGGRRDALFAFAEDRGQPWDSLELQLAFVTTELNGSEHRAGEWIRGTTGLAGAADAALNGYERPAERIVGPRLGHAADVLTTYYRAAGR